MPSTRRSPIARSFSDEPLPAYSSARSNLAAMRSIRKTTARPRGYFACAAEANPESEWAFRNLAVARSPGRRSQRCPAKPFVPLRKLAKDAASFSEWLKEEPAFDRRFCDPAREVPGHSQTSWLADRALTVFSPRR